MFPNPQPENYIQLHGRLFKAVQTKPCFDDSKTFVDAVPEQEPDFIMREYDRQVNNPGFNLCRFVRSHFKLPSEPTSKGRPDADTADMTEHINTLWDQLSRSPDTSTSPYSTLLPLPHPYIVPGGRFREIYYWDSYFTAEGLAVSGRLDMVKNMTDNFAWLIEEFGHVPNGNRVYYLSRSQPPFFVFMVDLLVRHRGRQAAKPYMDALRTEYQFWMRRTGDIPTRAIEVERDGFLNRYWDNRPVPREESYLEDYEMGRHADHPSALYRNLRAAAESGWDFSSRWLANPSDLSSIRTTDILPVDLNALLFFMETRLARWSDDDDEVKTFQKAAAMRRALVNEYFWNPEKGYYFDFNRAEGKQTDIASLAGTYPLFVGMANEYQVERTAEYLEQNFLRPGGLVTTQKHTGQQWDAPNGWAPLQWIATTGLDRYGLHKLARTIAGRWVDLNRDVYRRTGRMMEKYNVEDLSLKAGGGEYPTQDGFGWTNGVALAMIDKFGV